MTGNSCSCRKCIAEYMCCGLCWCSPQRRRKWLPQPWRKLSQGQVDKPVERPLIKKTSDKRLKLPTDKQSVDEESLSSTTTSQPPLASNSAADGEKEDEEPGLDLPPPMKPISDPTATDPSIKGIDGGGAADITEIERIVKEKMEQHEGKLKLDPLSSIDEATTAAEEGNDESGVDDNSASVESAETALRRRNFALKELISTEEKYIEDLALIVDGYMAEVRNGEDIVIPEDLKGGKEKMVFANITSIYEWHRDHFFKNLQPCLHNPANLGPLIEKSRVKLRQYIVYCQNKPVSEHIVAEHFNYFEEIRNKLKHKLVINDLLIKPVQRLMKYELILKDILKHTDRAGLIQECKSLQDAINVLNYIIKEANDMMDVGRLQNFEGKITAQGNLLLHGPLYCIEVNNTTFASVSDARNSSNGPKQKELQVFLFDQCIIFSEIVGKKTQFTNPAYIYKLHIQLNKMELKNMSSTASGDRFLIKSTDHKRQGLGFICTGLTPELHKKWFDRIDAILRSQRDFANAIQRPIDYQKILNSNSSSVSISTTHKSVPTTPYECLAPVPPAPTSSQSSDLAALHLSPRVEGRFLYHNTMGSGSSSISTTTTTTDNSSLNVTVVDSHRHSRISGQLSPQSPAGNGTVSGRATGHSAVNGGVGGGSLNGNEEAYYANATIDMVNVRLSKDVKQMSLQQQHENQLNNNGHPYLVKRESNGYSLTQQHHLMHSNSMQISPSSSTSSSLSNNANNNNHNSSATLRTEIMSRSQDVTVNEGTSAILSCRLKNYQYSKITWRKSEPESYILRQDEKYDISVTPTGEARLIIKHTRLTDSGVYLCCVENGLQAPNSMPYHLQCSIGLVVTPSQNPTSLYEPLLSIIDSKTISVAWNPANTPCYVEYCRIGGETMEWRRETANPVMSNYEIRNLRPGESYTFRLTNPQTGVVGVASLTLTLPANDVELWQLQHFSHRYTVLSELGRGRYSVVKLARDTGTGQLVASKQISRNLQALSSTQAEYKIISAITHSNVAKGLCLYQNAPHPGTDTIVMEYVHGPYLFSYIGKNKEYTETTVQFFMTQLLNAVHFIHGQKLMHLDLKPENILVDVSNIYSPVLKLIDFGNYIKYTNGEPLQLNNLEFAAPELLMEGNGTLIGSHTDMWAIGVFLYVFLSGVSPFLDDSSEETTSNIIKGDYCFPDEYFRGISAEAIELMQGLLVGNPEQRIGAEGALRSPWVSQNLKVSVISTVRLSNFVDRRTPPKANFSVPAISNKIYSS